VTDGPAIYLLTGLPGTGKYTVARALERALAKEGEEVRLVDNHYLCNPIFGLIAEDGMTQLPGAVWERVDEISEAVLRTIETLSPAEWSFKMGGGPWGRR
jgi:thymidylate kinase